MIVLVCLEQPVPGRASRAALDLACTLAPDAQIVAISAGGVIDSPALQLGRASPALARVVHLQDKSLDQADGMTIGTTLAEAARHLGATLILAGERSDEEGQGLVPAAIASEMHAHLVSRVQAVRVSASADTFEVKARAGGQLCTLDCPLPLVLTTSARPTALPELPSAPLREIEPLTLSQMGIDPSRLVPRPSLLGALVPPPMTPPREISLEEIATALHAHR